MMRLVVALWLLGLTQALCDDKLVIRADTKMSCHQTKGTCTALGHVDLSKKELRIRADRMDMTFTKEPHAIQTLQARGTVRIDMPHVQALGQKAHYEHNNHTTTLYGNPRIVLKDFYILSPAPCTFHHLKRQGHIQYPHMIFPTYKATLTAQTLTFKVKPSPKGDAMIHVTSEGDVLFVNTHVTIAAQRAVYDPNQKKLTLYGNVKMADAEGVALMDKAIYRLDTTEAFFHNRHGGRTKGLFRQPSHKDTAT
ncbi:LptA/OstA family protein [Candidatus Hepatobacter penaei]|uniref:LptA/OstA family protein n=1 Tax=Candidatus Hepatobacter penaei TaxID=1274402 RepID=UPI001093577D|nr:LptA/OstA family protein [Candidatus Hepatobacter penaei]TGW15181.1 hypothetical protein EIL50_02395 [bacterium NHP-B]